MALSIAELTALNDRIAHALERHIEPIFKRGTKVTLLARTPGNNEADVLVSSEGDLQDVLDMVARSMQRNVIGGPGVDRVPRLTPDSSAPDGPARVNGPKVKP